MRRLFVTIVLALPLLAACGGGGSTTKASTSATTTAAVADAAAANSGKASATTAPPNFSGNSSSSWCNLIRSFKDNTKLQDIAKDPKAWVSAANSAIDKVSANAPGPIKDDVATVVSGVRAMMKVLATDNYDFKKITPDQITAFSTPKFTDASTRIDAYDKQVCGVG